MPNLLTMLRAYDEGMFFALAEIWKVPITNMNAEEQRRALHSAMLEPERAERVYGILSDDERQALQTLLGSNGTMPARMFKHLYGDIRKMGKGAIERDTPHKQPATLSEGLYYRGLITESFEQSSPGMVPVVFIPDDLRGVLPLHKTAYDHLEDELPPLPDETVTELLPVEEDFLEDVRRADTSIVDDLCTLLAYLRNHGAGVEGDEFLPVDVERLAPYLLTEGVTRLNFLLGVGLSAGLMTTHEGQVTVKASALPNWLDRARSVQLKRLLDAWHDSKLYRDLWHVPGLHPDPEAGFPYDAQIARAGLLRLLKQFALPADWWPIDDFIDAVKLTDPDFQRPHGDYESWYIRNDAGEYLHGFESWDAIEGALLDFYIKGPLHWLGLVDVSDDAARLTAYGRAYLELAGWPSPPEPTDTITVADDGILTVSRKVSRVERYQVARFSTWGIPEDNLYAYRIDADGIQMAAQQGITTGHIATFLKRHRDGDLPPRISHLLDSWETGSAAASVTIEPLLVLRTTSPDVLDHIFNQPPLRQYLGARLGPTACVVRAEKADALRVALGDTGIKIE